MTIKKIFSLAAKGTLYLASATLLLLIAFRVASSIRESKNNREAAPKTGSFVHAGDTDLFVQTAGPANGPVIVLVHGTAAWSETWRDTMTTLAQHGYRAIAIDLPPFGFADIPPNQSYSPEEQGLRIAQAFSALKLNDAVLVGHSFGSRATVEAALMLGKKVKALVLVDAALGLEKGSVGPGFLTASLLALPPLRDALVASTITNTLLTKKILSTLVYNQESLTEAKVAIYQTPGVITGKTQEISAWLSGFLGPNTLSKSNTEKTYKELTLPTLLIWGEKDTTTPLSQADHILALLPHGTLSKLTNVGHIPQIEAPEKFNKLLLDFLTTIK